MTNAFLEELSADYFEDAARESDDETRAVLWRIAALLCEIARRLPEPK